MTKEGGVIRLKENAPPKRGVVGHTMKVDERAYPGFHAPVGPLPDATATLPASPIQAIAASLLGRLMLTVLGGLAEFERELIMARTGEGRLRAKARGVRFGRPRTLTPHQRQEAMQRLAEGEVQADLARSYGVSQATISRLSGDRPFEAGAAGAQ